MQTISENATRALGPETITRRVLDNGMTDIENRMPVLNDVWLYIHTNLIIASYFLVGIACVTSAIYVVGRLLTLIHRPAVVFYAFERRNQRGEGAVIPWTALLPVFLIGGNRQFGLGRKKIVEAALFDLGAVTDVLHAH